MKSIEMENSSSSVFVTVWKSKDFGGEAAESSEDGGNMPTTGWPIGQPDIVMSWTWTY